MLARPLVDVTGVEGLSVEIREGGGLKRLASPDMREDIATKARSSPLLRTGPYVS